MKADTFFGLKSFTETRLIKLLISEKFQISFTLLH